jgi:hypothetical protein
VGNQSSLMCTYQLICSDLCIGFCGECVLHQDLPGSYRRSSAYHSNGAFLIDFYPDGYGQTYRKGDIVGCGIDWVNSLYFFTLNGKQLGESLCFGCTATGLPCTKAVLRNDGSYSAAPYLSSYRVRWKERDLHLDKVCRSIHV